MEDLDGNEHGEYGTATIQGEALPIRLWEVGESDVTSLRGFLRLPEVDYLRYNVTLTVELDRLTNSVYKPLSSPVGRGFDATRRLTVQPEIVLQNVKLYDQKGDLIPAMQFDEVRVIVGPRAEAKLLSFVCVNLTPAERGEAT
jgi:hypothetical protein